MKLVETYWRPRRAAGSGHGRAASMVGLMRAAHRHGILHVNINTNMVPTMGDTRPADL